MRVIPFQKEAKREKIVKIALEESESGGTTIQVVAEHGERVFGGTIAKLLDDGTLEIYKGMSQVLGLQLDAEGHILTKYQ